jgi:hypothetical protein
MTDADGNKVSIDLADHERTMMVLGLNEYFGLAQQGPELLSPVVGQSTADGFLTYQMHLLEAIKMAEPLTDLDWARALFLTEASFGSELVGAGFEWDIGQSGDDTNIPALRSLQRKIGTAERSRLLQSNVAYPPPQGRGVNTRRRLHSNGDPIELDDDDRTFMCTVIGAYARSPRHGFRVLAPLVGQATFEAWATYVTELQRALAAEEDLADLDWMRALFLAEMGFTSVLVGFGSQFEGHDRHYIKILRGLQFNTGGPERYRLFRDSTTWGWIERRAAN